MGILSGIIIILVISLVSKSGNVINGYVVVAPSLTTISLPAGYTSQVALSWIAVTGAKSYVIYRATNANGPFANIGISTITSFTNSGLAGGTYYYKVNAIVSNNEVQVSGVTASIIPGLPVGTTGVITIKRLKPLASVL